ncbi:MAG: ChbG/HpnK family deacetylase [Negativicutes bacterium]
MERKIIINADDFGLHPAVNQGIIDGFCNGCITSTSIMPGGAAFDEAVKLASSHPKLGIGVHLMLVGGRAVCKPAELPTLADAQGNLSLDYPVFLKRYFTGKINKQEIRRELTAQVDKVSQTGLVITHLDSHQHMHIVPGIIDIVLDIAAQFAIPSIRIPAEPLLFFGGYPLRCSRFIARTGLSVLAEFAARKVRQRGLRAPDHFFGMLAGGNLQLEYLLTIIRQLPSGVSEIMMHPGVNDVLLQKIYQWGYHWQDELQAVTSVHARSCLQEEKVKLISFRELCDEPIN